jgi:hypothetical protein
MNNIYKLAPPGIDIFARRQWVIDRRFGREIRDTLDRLRRHHAHEPDGFDFAANAYISGLDKSLADFGRSGRVMCRLARAYARRFRKELDEENKYLRLVTRHALLGGT